MDYLRRGEAKEDRAAQVGAEGGSDDVAAGRDIETFRRPLIGSGLYTERELLEDE